MHMGQDEKKLAEELTNLDKSRKLAEALGEIKKLAASDEGKKLAASFGKQGKESAAKAAEDMKKGEMGAAKSFIESLTKTEEGKALLSKLTEITK